MLKGIVGAEVNTDFLGKDVKKWYTVNLYNF